MTSLFASDIFLLTLTIGVFLGGKFCQHHCKSPIVQPLVIATALVVIFLHHADIPLETFNRGTSLLSFMLGPCVVALGFVLYEHFEHLKVNVISILAAVTAGCVVGVASTLGIAHFFGADRELLLSLAPHSVTAPIAISVARHTGGVPELAVAFVVISGVFGALVGPILLRLLKVKSGIAHGLAMGSAAHALGTARAFEMGMREGALGGLAIGIMGVITALLIPLIEHVML